MSLPSTVTTTSSTSEASEKARHDMIERHLPLVTYTVGRMTDLIGSGVMEREDAIGHGVKGLIGAVDNFDATKGASFSTYAVLRIRGAIIDAARAMDILPRSQRQRARDIEQTTLELANLLGRWPTVKEIALKSGLNVTEVKHLQHQRGLQIHSLDQAMSSRDEDYEWPLEDTDENTDPATVADRKAVSKLLSAAIGSLGERDREVIHMHYNKGLTFRHIGNHLNISESRVSQIHQRVLTRLRTHFESHDAA